MATRDHADDVEEQSERRSPRILPVVPVEGFIVGRETEEVVERVEVGRDTLVWRLAADDSWHVVGFRCVKLGGADSCGWEYIQGEVWLVGCTNKDKGRGLFTSRDTRLLG